MEENKTSFDQFVYDHPQLVSFAAGVAVGATLMYFRMNLKPFVIKIED